MRRVFKQKQHRHNPSHPTLEGRMRGKNCSEESLPPPDQGSEGLTEVQDKIPSIPNVAHGEAHEQNFTHRKQAAAQVRK